MEYQKTSLLDNAPNQRSKFRTKNWVKINNDSLEMHKTKGKLNIKFQC